MVEKRHYPQEGVIEEVMSDTILRDLVLRRLDADNRPEDEWSALVLAALEGPDELEKLLDGRLSPRAPSAVTGGEGSAISAPVAGAPRNAFLRTITVEGFRGIDPTATLDLTPGPGLNLVVGRNGSGKSSFAEGLELLLTGDTYRWRDRSRIWRDGWLFVHPDGLKGGRVLLRPVRLERWGGAPSGVPKSDDLYLTQAGGHTVVHVVADTREVNATQSGGATGCRHSARGLIGNEGQSGGKIVSQRTGCRGPVGCPPGGGSLHLTRRAARDNDRKGRHVQPERRRSSSAAEMTSPRSASAIDSASSASWAAVSSKGASRSSAMTVTRDPSGRSTPPSGTIAPPLTRAVKTCMDIVYPRRITSRAMLNGPKVPPTPDRVGPEGSANV
jgi:hypothetical protein